MVSSANRSRNVLTQVIILIPGVSILVVTAVLWIAAFVNAEIQAGSYV